MFIHSWSGCIGEERKELKKDCNLDIVRVLCVENREIGGNAPFSLATLKLRFFNDKLHFLYKLQFSYVFTT